VEFKLSSYGKLGTRLNEAALKSDIAVLKPTVILTDEKMKRFVNGAWGNKDIKNLKTIIIINDGKTYIYNRKS
jgi:hypothetical protein